MKPTSTPNLTPQSAAEELIITQALALYRNSKTIADNAPHGQFLNHAEAAIINKGREFIRTTLQTLAQEEIHDIEKNETRECPKCQTKTRPLGYRSKKIFTAAGNIKVKRRYEECRPCNLPEHVVDDLLGSESYTVGLRCLAAHAGIDRSFQQSAETLLFYCGLKIGVTALRRICYYESDEDGKIYATHLRSSNEFYQSRRQCGDYN